MRLTFILKRLVEVSLLYNRDAHVGRDGGGEEKIGVKHPYKGGAKEVSVASRQPPAGLEMTREAALHF